MVNIDALTSDVADLLMEVAKRRRLEAAKKRRERDLEVARREIEASRPAEIQRIVLN